MDRYFGTVSADGREWASGVTVWVRGFTTGSGSVGWEGHFEATVPLPPGPYTLTTVCGRRGSLRITHTGLMSHRSMRSEFTGCGPFGEPSGSGR